METKNLTIETLSPIFIWKGEDYSKFDYTAKLIDREVLIEIYDIDKLINDLGKYFDENEIFKILDEIEEGISNNEIFDIIAYLKSKNANIPLKKYIIRKYKTGIKDFLHEKRDIKQFINQNSMPYIPGSSIKGAINTALIYYELKNWSKEKIEKLIKSSSLQPNRGNINVSTGENKYSISDTNIEVNKDGEGMLTIFKAQRFYIYHINKNKIGNFNNKAINYIEGLKPNQTINLKIKCSDEMFDKIKKACNELSLKICEWELSLLEKYNKGNGIKNAYNGLIGFYGNLLKDIKSSDAIFLNIGWGGGYLPKTIYLLANEKNIEIEEVRRFFPYSKKKQFYRDKINNYDEFPFTRVITQYLNPEKRKLVYYPFGWMRIEG